MQVSGYENAATLDIERMPMSVEGSGRTPTTETTLGTLRDEFFFLREGPE